MIIIVALVEGEGTMKKKLPVLLVALCILVGLAVYAIPTAFSAVDSGQCSASLTWTFDSDTCILRISGTGSMTNWAYNSSSVPWHKYRTQIKYVEIEPGVSYIGSAAFANCAKLRAVSIPASVTSIGAWAFEYCTALSSVTIPGNMTAIQEGTFHGCSSLKTVSIPAKVKTIGAGAFAECSGLTSVVLSNGITSIGANAFSLCSKLASVRIPDSVTSVGDYAFNYCSALNSVSVSGKISAIPEGAFYGCSALASVTVPKNVSSIGAYAFYGCNGLKKMYVLNSNCTIFDREDTIVMHTGGVIYGHGASTAKAYALKLGYAYQPLCGCANSGYEFTTKIVTPTCTNAGSEQIVCSNCGSTQTVATLPATGHAYFYRNNESDHSLICATCSHSYNEAHSYRDGLCICGETEPVGPALDESIVMYHSLNLASDIAINYAVKTTALEDYDSYYLECVLPVYQGNEQVGTETVTLQPELQGNYYYFVLNELVAFEMNNTVEAVLHMTKDGREYVSNGDSYSIATYAYAQLDNPAATEDLKILSANLLRYGAKAQIWKKYRTEALADAQMTDSQKALLQDLEAVEFGNNNEILSDVEIPLIDWVGKTMSLESKVVVRFVMNASNYMGDLDALSLRVSFVNIDGETETVTLTESTVYNEERHYYAFDFDGLLSAEMRSVMHVAVCEGDMQLSPTMVYSIDTYGVSTSGALRTLVQAMLAYGDSAKAFFVK
jgi:hypothetical protein